MLIILFLITNIYAADYNNALNNAANAAYKQSGMEKNVQTFQSYVENKLPYKKELTIPLGCYTIIKERNISIPLQHNRVLVIHDNGLEIQIKL